MASKGTIFQQGDGLDTLKNLMEAIRDPQAITAAHETYRKEMALTEAEQAKMDAARAFMADYEDKLADLTKKQNQLDSDTAYHADHVDQFSNEIAAKQAELDGFAASLDAKQEQLDTSVSLHEKDKADFYAVKSSYDDTVNTKNSELQDRENIVAQREQELAIKSDNLAQYEAQLKIKAAKVRASIEEI